MILFCGVDPGQSGGLSVLNEIGEPFWKPYSFKDQTPHDISNVFQELSQFDAICAFEKVHSMPRQGVASSFKFGHNTGVLAGIITAFKIKHYYISPQGWQKEMGCLTGGDKNVSKAMAQRLFPKLTVTHDIADSLIIAEYCRRTRT